MLSMICAVGRGNEIGFENKLLWDLPGDMKHFKETTTGHTVIMGQTTYLSIGRPLPNRTNIILSNDDSFDVPGCIIARDLEQLAREHENTEEEVFVIGGASIYRQFLPFAKKLYLTLIDDAPTADTFFPDYSEFTNIISEEAHEEKGINYKFVELTR